ncbi:hypothetical protein ZWY2020_042287 [Hordeum vulgare]|nr:hypothetical protein ZWY2020_042287 [Hordeum vulgare]
MAMEKLPEVNPPSDRVPGRGLLTLLISKALRWRNDGEIRDSGYASRVSDRRDKYRPKEGVRGGGAHPAAGQAVRAKTVAAWQPCPSAHLRDPKLHADFYIFFSRFLGVSKFG